MSASISPTSTTEERTPQSVGGGEQEGDAQKQSVGNLKQAPIGSSPPAASAPANALSAGEPPTRPQAAAARRQQAAAAAAARRNNTNSSSNNNNNNHEERIFTSTHRLVRRESNHSRNRLQIRNGHEHWSAKVWKFVNRLAHCGRGTGVQVIFSSRAIVSCRQDIPCPCLQFRLFDMERSHPVVQASCSIYLVTQKSLHPIPLRIAIPTEEFGSILFLSLPSEVAHAIDEHSPLDPSNSALLESKNRRPPSVPRFASIGRQPGSNTGNNKRGDDDDDDENEDAKGVFCPVCGESYGTVANLIRHGKYREIMEYHDKFPFQGSHQEVDWDEFEEIMTQPSSWSYAELKDNFEQNISEVICVVEGIDPVSIRSDSLSVKDFKGFSLIGLTCHLSVTHAGTIDRNYS